MAKEKDLECLEGLKGLMSAENQITATFMSFEK